MLKSAEGRGDDLPDVSASSRTLGAGGPSPPAFDEAGLLARVDGDVDLACAVADAFLDSFEESLQALALAAGGSDGLALARAAHALKGACLTMGGPECAELASQIEAAAKLGDLPAATSLVPEVRPAVLRLADALRAFQRSHGGP